MSVHAAIALLQLLLTHNFRDSLPFIIMTLVIQGIRPESIFEFLIYFNLNYQQYRAIRMAMMQLRLYASMLPAIKGCRHISYQNRRRMIRQNPQHPVSQLFESFQQRVLLIALNKNGFVGDLQFIKELTHFIYKLADIPPHSRIFSVSRLFLLPDVDLNLMKIAFEMQKIIEHTRLSYPEIVFFFTQNENALRNIILVWKNQVSACKLVYDSQYPLTEPIKMSILFVFCIIAVIDSNSIDKHLAEFIKSYGNSNIPLQISQKYQEFILEQDNCLIHQFDIREICSLFSSMKSSNDRGSMIEYSMIQWSLGFGHIGYSNQFEFESPIAFLRSHMPIFGVFANFWEVFFRNFARTFVVSFLPFGNILWSEAYTRLCATNFDWIIRIAVENFALRIGAKDDHSFLRKKISWMSNRPHSEITTASYGGLIFPDTIRNRRMSSEICSCFIQDFWRAHRKPDPNMSDIDYIQWLFSIPEYAVFGRSWVELMNDLQNRKELPKILDGSSGNFRYLSCTTSQIDLEIQKNYDENFGRQLGREPKISDYFK